MIEVMFFHCAEIRMGSPHQVCQIELDSEWVPSELTRRGDWIKVEGRSDNRKYLAFAFWETTNNEPGFRVAVVDTEQKRVQTSERLPGCCEALQFDGDKLHWSAYPGLSGQLEMMIADHPMDKE